MDTTIHINVADIPPEVGESFGRVTLAGFKKFIAQPGNREKLEAQTAARKARKERECTASPPNRQQLVPRRRSLL